MYILYPMQLSWQEKPSPPEGQLQEWQLPSPDVTNAAFSLESCSEHAGAKCALTNETWFYKMEATLWDAMPLVALKIFTAQVGLEWCVINQYVSAFVYNLQVLSNFGRKHPGVHHGHSLCHLFPVLTIALCPHSIRC